jgi:RIO kinase 1
MPGDGEEETPSPPADEQAPMLELEDLGEDHEAMVRFASNDEWAFRRAEKLVGKLPHRRREHNRDTESEVFDRPTLLTLHKLLVHGVLKSLDFPVATGKEANVFRGTTPGGGYVAVKIYRVNTSTFKHVLQYIQGDERFEGLTGDKRSMVAAFCQKEFRNLARLREVGVAVPEPIKAIHNVLVTEYLGVKEGPWPTLKQYGRLDDPQRLWDQVSSDYVKAYNLADLVHADLSEYNIMLEGAGGPAGSQRARLIDVGQAVLKSHPMATQFRERDLKVITQYFRRQGVDAQPEQVASQLRHEMRGRVEKVRFVRAGADEEGAEGEEEE